MIHEPGQIVADRYRILSTLGVGQYGVVYRAEDISLQKDVALKMLNMTDSASTALLRFQKEARAAAKLKHSNIVTVLDFRLDDKNNFYLVLELIQGMSLRALIRSHGKLRPDECMPLFQQILSGLAHAHESGVIHRDLNPNNVLVDFRNPQMPTAKIVDFGLAWLTDDDQRLTREGVAVGTPEFMSPEQCHGQETDARSDIYSFGCLMFDALAGRPPHQRDTVVDTIMCHINFDAPTLEEVCPDVVWPRNLSDVVAKSLRRDPAERYQTADELAEALLSIPIETHAVELDEQDKAMMVQPDAVPIIPSLSNPLGHLNATANASVEGASMPWSVVVAITFILFMAVVVVLYGQELYDRIGSFNSSNSNTDTKQSNKHAKQQAITKGPDTAETYGYRTIADRMGGSYDGVTPLVAIEKAELLPGDSSGEFTIVACTTDEKIKLVKGRSDISCLRLTQPFDVKGTGLKYLKGLPLEALEIRRSAMDDQTLANYLPAIPSLAWLSLSNGPYLTGSTLDKVAQKVPNVVYLDVSAWDLNDDGLEKITNFKKLVSLHIGRNRNLKGTTFCSLASLKNLKEVHAMYSPIEPKYWKCLNTFPQVDTFNSPGAKVQANDLQFLRQSKLVNLSLGKSNLDDDCLKVIAGAPHLDCLTIEKCPKVTGKGISYLAKSPLRILDCSSANLTDSYLTALQSLKKLRKIKITETTLSTAQAADLLRNSNITELDVSFPITVADTKKLQSMFPGRRVTFLRTSHDRDIEKPAGLMEPDKY